jgi:predicted alpha/beta-hydrolase family hydrolase
MNFDVAVPGGTVPVAADDACGRDVLILAHGAGGNMEQKTVLWLAGLARECGLGVVRFNFLYKAQGRSMPDRMPVLVETYQAVIDEVRSRLSPGRLLIGGHSMGGRTASMLLAESPTAADGLVLFGYPLHPPGRPDKLRDAHLASITVPVLQMNGTEDEFCTRELMEKVDLPSGWTLHWIVGANHSYSVSRASGRTKADAEREIVETLGSWLTS